MAKRSLKASPSGIAVAKRAFQRTGWTQEYLAGEVGLETRQSIWKFFSGRPVERHIFIEICFRLDLEWEEIAKPPEVDPLPTILSETSDNKELDGWVTQLRSRYSSHIEACCNPLQSPVPLTQPRSISQTYVAAEVLSDLTAQRWLTVDELEASMGDSTTFSPTNVERLSAIDVATQHSHLVVTGKPGAGKTTFLKYLALQCNAKKFRADCVPIFLSLQQVESQLVESTSLVDILCTQWRTDSATQSKLEMMLQQGRVLLLLDGLDEVTPAARTKVSNHIKVCFETFPKTTVVVSHRSSGIYAYLPGFQYVELADFSDDQINTFSQQWFAESHEQGSNRSVPGKQFLKQIYQPENSPLLELSRSPLLLTLLCSIFQKQQAFPKQTDRFYRACWDLLLTGWDQARGIVRGRLAKNNLSEGLSSAVLLSILGQLATVSLNRGCYFLDRQTVLQTIAQYLIDSETVTHSLEQLYHHSETLMLSILANTGLLVEQSRDIYALPTVGFYSYLTTRSPAGLKSNPPRSLKALTTKMAQPAWHIAPLTALGLSPAQWAVSP